MSQKLLLIAAVLAHNLGSIILVGSLIFVQWCYLPAIAEVRNPQVRMRLRLDAIGLLFGWLWVGIALIYISGFWALFAFADLFGLPVHVAWMTGLSVLLALLLVSGHLGLLWSARWALEAKQAKKARRLYGWLNWLLNLALVVAVATMLLGVSGAVLVR